MTTTQAEIDRLGPWFHNLHLPGGIQTAPNHPLGDFPAAKWRQIASELPEDLSGWTVLDVGCNAGFYSVELARRGGEVVGIDHDPHYLEQARWVVEHLGLSDRIQLKHLQVYDLLFEPEQYDLVLLMGVLYHLRYPLLVLDRLAELTRRLMVFQTLTMPGPEKAASDVPHDLPIDQREQMQNEHWPKMAFIEQRLANDPTNWWAPSPACVQAMLRNTGLRVTNQPGHEIYICEPHTPDREEWTLRGINDLRLAIDSACETRSGSQLP